MTTVPVVATALLAMSAVLMTSGLARPFRGVRALTTQPLPRRHIVRVPRWLPALSRRRREARLDHAMPDLLDLLVVTLQAGLPAPAAFVALAPHVSPVVAPAIVSVLDRCSHGERFVDALDGLVDHLGTRALGLVAAIGAAERSGLPLAPTVDRIADDARSHRRRSAEIDARRLPVRLALPLVCCTLPSFVCIAIGPVLVGALTSLRSM